MKFLAFSDLDTPLNTEFSKHIVIEWGMEDARSIKLFELTESLVLSNKLNHLGDFAVTCGHGSRILVWPLAKGHDYHMGILSHKDGVRLECPNYAEIGSLPTPTGYLTIHTPDIGQAELVISEYYSQFQLKATKY